jgi:hypothetical protein
MTSSTFNYRRALYPRSAKSVLDKSDVRNPETHRRLVSAARSPSRKREASAQFFSNEVQFNTTDTGCNAVEVTGMGKRNLLPSGLTAQLRAATPACDLSIPAGLKIVLGELVGEFTLPVNSTDIMLRSGVRYIH